MIEAGTGPSATAPPASIHDQFRARARLDPGRPAVTFGSRTLSYAEVEQRALVIASHLQRRGVTRGTLVAIQMAPGADSICAVLGVLMAGAAYVPIDAGYPLDRVRYIIQDSGAGVVITDQEMVPLPGVDAIVIDPTGDHWPGDELAEFIPPSSDPGDLAYIIYTSGSTGAPKGVEVEHRNVTRLFSSTHGWFEFSAQDVWTLFHSLAFDFSVWEIWGALLHGGRLVVVPRSVARSTADFVSLVRRERVTVLNQTPSAFAEFVRVEAQDPAPDRLNLRLVVLGGEALRFALLEPWFRRHPDSSPRVVNMYGITETTVHVTYRRIRAEDVWTQASVIGVPIPDLRTYVVERDGGTGLAAPGAVGELLVGGAGVTRGYRHRPELTAERFVSNPFDASPAVLYRSGDLVRLNEEGELEYVGRADQQLKVRGYRIEPGEVEAALVTHPEVQEGAVVARPGPDGVLALVAYVVPHERGRELRPGEVREHVRAHLPEFMVPERIVTLDSLPRTVNGKVDRDALLLHGEQRSSDAAPYAPPRDRLEHQLVAIWEELLGVRPIGIADDFFDLGGHSLIAVRMVRQVGLAIGRPVPVTLLYEHHTIQALAKALADATPATVHNPVTVIRGEGSWPPLFFLHGDHQGGGFYSIDLGRQISADLPVYGLQPHGIDGLPVPATVQEMARFYLPLIRSVRSHGPYLLAGFRPASYIALEIAQQLTSAGEEVPVVVMIDPGRPKERIRLAHLAISAVSRPLRVRQDTQVDMFLRFQTLFHRLKSLGGDTLNRAGGAAPAEGEAVSTLVRRRQVQLRPGNASGGGQVARWQLQGDDRDLSRWAREERHEEEFGRYAWATAAYRPSPYRGRVVIFWSTDAAEVPSQAPGVTRWWGRRLRNLEVRFVPGDHASSVTRYGDVMARELRAVLDPRGWSDPL